MYEVQKNVPFFQRRPVQRRRRKYPFDQMDLNDFFFVPEKTPEALSAYLSSVARKLGYKFKAMSGYAQRTGPTTWVECDPTAPGAVEGTGVWRTQ